LFESLLYRASSVKISKTLLVNSSGDLTKNQFCQDLIISETQLISKATTGTHIDRDSIIVIQNESILEGKRQTSDLCKLSIIDNLSNNHKKLTDVSFLYLCLKDSSSIPSHHIFNLSQGI